jgi:hypothetical protein
MKILPTGLPARSALLFFVFIICGDIHAQAPPATRAVSPPVLTVAVTDENGVAVSSARVSLHLPSSGLQYWCVTDFAGHCYFRNLSAGAYEIRVQKPGFYAVSGQAVEVGQLSSLDVKLFHIQEVREVVNVVESPPGIDPAQTAAGEQLTGMDILNIPYPATHDYRNVLNYIPGVVQDQGGQPHIAGAQTYQTLTLFDGFNITQPANGLLLLRVSTDAIRSINVENSRISAEHGKGSGGVLSMNTGIGDDHFRAAATNFFPAFQFTKGFHFDNIVPRITFSGPIRKGKIWFFEGADAEYDNNVFRELPDGADTDHFWRVGNLAKIQMNLAPGNILTASYLLNRQRDQYLGLSSFSPPATTPRNIEWGDFAMGKDQIYFSGGQLLEIAFNFDQYLSELLPRGTQQYVLSNQAAQGNYYLHLHTVARRWQGLANLSLAPHQWHGRHEFKVGIDLDRLAYNPLLERTPIVFLRGQQASGPVECLSVPSPCSRYSTFAAGPHRELHNLELSGYVQDRWSLTNRLLLEAGLRYDWDEIVRDSLFSPRLAATYVLDNQANTKLSAGIGVFHDATNLVLISRPFAGQRVDYFFDGNGIPELGDQCASPPPGNDPAPCPIPMTFAVNQDSARAPRFLNWSVSLERKLPAEVYVKAEYIQRHGIRGLVFNKLPGSPQLSGDYVLQNSRRDHYDAVHLGARKAFRKNYLITGAYTFSRARSNQVLDFNVDNPIYSAQLSGPYQWDAPHRFVSTGIVPAKLPFLRQVDVEYSSETRTGFPFYVVNHQQQVVPPTTLRFPTYFTLNLFLEKRFHFLGYFWAVRGGFNNITNRGNPGYVNNDIDSGGFLTFGGFSHRAFTTRIRLLERK